MLKKFKATTANAFFSNYNFKFQVIVGGGAVHTEQHRVLLRCDEAQGQGVHLGVGTLLDVVVVPDQARLRTPFVSHGLCNSSKNKEFFKELLQLAVKYHK